MIRTRSAAFFACVYACSDTAAPPPFSPAGADASAPVDAGIRADASGTSDADSSRDTGPDAPIASSALHVFSRGGASDDDPGPTVGPGIVLDGGYGAPSVMQWMHHASVGDGASRGDVVILSPANGDATGGWLSAASFHSAQTVALSDGATADDFRIAAAIVARAEVVWFTGGDQAKYVRWKGTPLMDAVDAVIGRGGAVGGSSAGMIILGQHVNDALVTISENITTPLAVADPYDARIHFTQNVVHFDRLARVVTDPHFSARDRMGRLVAFMARQVKDGFASPDVLGVGVDDGAALAIDAQGVAVRLADSDAPSAYVVRGGVPTVAMAGTKLVYQNLHVVKIARATHAYDFARRCGRGFVRDFGVDGNLTPPYPATVYSDGAFANECP